MAGPDAYDRATADLPRRRSASEVIEEALRRDLGLDLLERLWAKNGLGDAEAMSLAATPQHARVDPGL